LNPMESMFNQLFLICNALRMRKTFGYHAYKSGTAIELIMIALNHSSVASTKRYIGLTQDDIDNVYISTCL
jgi:integrase